MTSEQYAAAVEKVHAFLADPFGQQVLRDLIPPGRRLTIALPDETVEDALNRAWHDSGSPAYLAVDTGQPEPVLLVVEGEMDDDNWMTARISRPGDWAAEGVHFDSQDTLAHLILALRRAHGETS